MAALQDLAGDRATAVVVLDDAHFLPTEVARAVVRLATQAPHAARFVVIGREAVPFPQLPLDVAVSTLPGSDLRFTDDEAAALVLALAPAAEDESLNRIVREGPWVGGRARRGCPHRRRRRRAAGTPAGERSALRAGARGVARPREHSHPRHL